MLVISVIIVTFKITIVRIKIKVYDKMRHGGPNYNVVPGISSRTGL